MITIVACNIYVYIYIYIYRYIFSKSNLSRFSVKLFAYDTVKKYLTPKLGEDNKILVPASFIAGAVAGFSSTFCTYPLELLKTRLTVQVSS